MMQPQRGSVERTVPYDLELAERVRDALTSEPDVTERKMFGGLAFLVRGNMTVVVSGKGGLMIRADTATSDELVATTSAEFAEMKGRQMQGWLRLATADVEAETDFETWVARAVGSLVTDPRS